MSDEQRVASRETAPEGIGADDSSDRRATTHHPSPITHRPSSVSVVVPSYNHARFVGKTLRSVFVQTRAPSELIVIDDGSADDSVRVIERALRDCPFPCELIARPNRGLCATLNEGFARAGGRYFAYLGSDDLWLPEFLRARVETLEAQPRAVLAYGHAYTIDGEGRITDCTTDWADYTGGDVRRMLLGALAPLSPTVLYRRGALARHRWNEASRLEDYELYLRLSAEGEFAFDPRVLSAWRVHGSNASEDLEMMLRERLAAQRSVGPALGLGARELEGFRALATFRSAQEFMRRGAKLRSLRLALAGLGGVPTAREAARYLAGLAAPRALLRRRQAARREKAFRRYGSVEL